MHSRQYHLLVLAAKTEFQERGCDILVNILTYSKSLASSNITFVNYFKTIINILIRNGKEDNITIFLTVINSDNITAKKLQYIIGIQKSLTCVI